MFIVVLNLDLLGFPTVWLALCGRKEVIEIEARIKPGINSLIGTRI